MNNSYLAPVPWKAIPFALLPGILAVLSSAGLFPVGPGRGFLWWQAASVAYLVLALVLKQWKREWWPLLVPAYLVMLGQIAGFVAFIGFFLLPLVAVGGYWWARRAGHRGPIPRGVAPLVGALMLLFLVRAGGLPLLSAPSESGFSWLERIVSGLSAEGGLFIFTLAVSLVPILLGLPLARRYGLLALLFVLSAQQLWMGIWDLDYGLLIWTDNVRGELLLSIWLPLFYLVVTPLWIMRARSRRGLILGFLLAPAIGLLSGEWMRSLILQATPRAYTLDSWLLRGSFIVEFLLLLALAVLLYGWIGAQGDGEKQKFTSAPLPEALTSGIR